jgi:outer membrane protein
MKQLKGIAFLAMMVFGSVFTFAQDIVYVDVQAVYEVMPAYKKAEADIEALGKKHQDKLAALETEYKTFVDGVQKQLAGKSPEESQKIITTNKYQEKDQELQQKFQAVRQAAQEEIAAKEKALFEPIEKRVNDAIGSVAAKKGVKYVLPAGVLIYKNGGYDLFNDVKKELGL